MSKIWQIYKDGSFWAEKNASEIRSLIKSGEILPTDEVALPLSKIRQAVFEVDEIFEESLLDGVYGAQEHTSQPTVVTGGLGAKLQTFSKKLKRKTSRKKKNKAVYFLLNPSGKVSGPHPANAILSMFHKGLISSRLRVKRYGSVESLPISKFVLNYSKSQRNELKQRIKGNNLQMNSKRLNDASQIMGGRNKAVYDKIGLALSFVISLILVAGGSIVYNKINSLDSNLPVKTTSVAPGKTPKLLKKAKKLRPDNKGVERKKDKKKQPLKPNKKSFVAKKNKPIRRYYKKNRKNQPSRTQAARPLNSQQTRNSLSAKTTPSPIELATRSGPKVNSVGPVSFSERSLEGCDELCLLVVKDRKGLRMYVRFFKEEFYPQLRGKSKKVTLVGHTKLESNRLYMFLQQVR